MNISSISYTASPAHFGYDKEKGDQQRADLKEGLEMLKLNKEYLNDDDKVEILTEASKKVADSRHISHEERQAYQWGILNWISRFLG